MRIIVQLWVFGSVLFAAPAAQPSQVPTAEDPTQLREKKESILALVKD